MIGLHRAVEVGAELSEGKYGSVANARVRVLGGLGAEAAKVEDQSLLIAVERGSTDLTK